MLLAAGHASAQNPPRPPQVALQFHYERGRGTQDCPDAHQMEDLLLSEFGYDAIQPGAAPVLTIAVSQKGRDRWDLEGFPLLLQV